MAKVFRLLVQLPPLLIALIFGAQGVMWLINPTRAAVFWGFDVPEGGMALSSMIGAFSGWALVISSCLLIALFRKERVWYYPPVMIFVFLALGRIVAGAAHGAPHLPERFIPEVVFAGLIFLASRFVAERGSHTG
ncbi:MAG: hypothetical protein AAGK01_06475 [Pseudomonadota bacterium]